MEEKTMTSGKPVLLDTDIGSDMDDARLFYSVTS